MRAQTVVCVVEVVCSLQGKENKMKAKHIDESRLKKTKQNGKWKDETR